MEERPWLTSDPPDDDRPWLSGMPMSDGTSIGSTQPPPLFDVIPEWIRNVAAPVTVPEERKGILSRFADYATTGALSAMDEVFGKPVPAFDIGTRELTEEEQRFENIPQPLQFPVGALRGTFRFVSKNIGMIPAMLQGTPAIEQRRAKEFGFRTPSKLGEFVQGMKQIVADLPTQMYYGAGRSIGLDPKDFIEEADKPAIRRGIESPEDAAMGVATLLGGLKVGGRAVGAIEGATVRAYPTMRNKVLDAKSRMMRPKVEMPTETPVYNETPTVPVIHKEGLRIIDVEPLSAKVGKTLGVGGVGYVAYKTAKHNMDEEDVKMVDAGIDNGMTAFTSMGLVAAGLAMGRKGKLTIEVPELAAAPSTIGQMNAVAEGVVRNIARWKPSMAAKIVTAQGSLQNTIRQFTDFGNGAKELFVDPIREAHHVSQIQQKATLNDFNGVLKDNGVGFLNRGTISDKIARYAISKQQGGSELLASMKKEIPTLTESEMSIYQYMRQELERRHPIINQTRKLAGMAPIGYIDDYWMLWRGLDDVFGAGKLVDGDAGWFNTKDIPNLINEEVAAKFVKKRAVNGSEIPISLDAFGDFEKYISISTDYIRKLPTLVDMKNIVTKNYGTASPYQANLQRAGQGTLGEGLLGGGEPWKLAEENPQAFTVIRDFINHQAGIRKGFDNSTAWGRTLNKVVPKLTRNMARAGLSFNIQSTLIQPTAYLNFASQVGSRWALRGVEALFSPEIRNQIMNKSQVMFGREHDVSIVESHTGAANTLGRAVTAASDFGLAPLKQLDLYTAEMTWWGAYQKALNQLKLSEDGAITYADDMVIRTQGSASPVDIAPAQRTPLGRAATLYQTFVINNWGMLTQDIGGIGGASIMNKQQRIAAAARYTIGSMVVNSLYDAAGLTGPIPNPISGYVRIDERTGQQGGIGGAAEDLAANLPVVGGGFRYGSSVFGAVAQLGQDVTKSPLMAGASILGVPGARQIKKFSTPDKQVSSKTRWKHNDYQRRKKRKATR